MATPYYGLILPTVGASADTWGGTLNAALTSLDTQLASPANTLKGNNTESTAASINLTVTQATAMLNAVVGDSGSGGTKGLVPAPAAGDAAAGKFLGAGGSWGYPTRARGNFDGTTGTTVLARGVTCVRTGAGEYTFTLSPAAPHANYEVFASSSSVDTLVAHPTPLGKSTTTFSVLVADLNDLGSDPSNIFVRVEW